MRKTIGSATGVALWGLLAIVAAPQAANASIKLISGNSPQPGEQNVLFKSDQTGTTVTGFTNKSDTEVDFSSAVDTLSVSSKGQAKISNAGGGNITDLTVTPLVFVGDLIVNLNGGPTAGTVDITVDVAGETPTVFTGEPIKKNGENFYTIVASGGEKITSVNFSSTVGFGEFQQPRLSGVAGVIPEPSTWAMMLLGFAGLGYAGLRKARGGRSAFADA